MFTVNIPRAAQFLAAATMETGWILEKRRALLLDGGDPLDEVLEPGIGPQRLKNRV
jgi:hypothetical protein